MKIGYLIWNGANILNFFCQNIVVISVYMYMYGVEKI